MYDSAENINETDQILMIYCNVLYLHGASLSEIITFKTSCDSSASAI